jgi:1,4-dihydroxy-2-naphthoate octaprenyltransferase
LQQPIIFILSIFSILLLYFYSYPPIQLSYRGGGEILQMIGVGLILPLYGFLVQSPNINSFQWGILPSLLLLNLTSAMSTSLPDEPSDRLTKKQTSTVLLGDSRVKKIIILIELFAIFLLHYWAVTTMGKKLIEPMFLSLYLIPLLSLIGLKGKPGEISLQIFVFFSILTTLASQLLILYFYLYD